VTDSDGVAPLSRGSAAETPPRVWEVAAPPAADRWWRRYEYLGAGVFAILLLALGALTINGHYRFDDVNLYHRYALSFWNGAPRFHQLPLEYPPLAIVPMTLVFLPPLNYVWVYGLWMSVAALAGFLLVARLTSWRNAAVYGAYLLVGATGTLLGRYDIVPAVATVAALWAVRRGRFRWAYSALAAGVLLKLYPLLLLPVILIEHRRQLAQWSTSGDESRRPPWSGMARPVRLAATSFGAVIASGLLVPALLAPGGWTSPYAFALQRPIQVESVPASVLWLVSFLGFPVHPDHSFHSFNLVGGLDTELKVLSLVALAAGCVWVYFRQASGRLSVGRAAFACVCVVIATSKVFSPQYIMWVLPLAAMEEGPDLQWLAIAALTTAVFPVTYLHDNLRGPAPAAYSALLLALVTARNALFVQATWRAIVRSAPAPPIAITVAGRALRQRRMPA